LDSEYELYNYNARLYDPVMSRFISPDTIIPDPYNPQSLNRYSYCLNNPLKYVDPSGNYAGVYAPGSNPWSSVDWWNSFPSTQGNESLFGLLAGPALWELYQKGYVVRSRTATLTSGPLMDDFWKKIDDIIFTSKEFYLMVVPNVDQFMWDLNGNSSINLNGGSINSSLMSALIEFTSETNTTLEATSKRGTTRNLPGDSKTSQHYTGNAIDFRLYDKNGKMLSNKETADLARQSQKFTGIEISELGKGFVHVDLRTDSRYSTSNPLLMEQIGINPYRYNYMNGSEFWKNYEQGKYLKYPTY
ncbi:MAG: hypothetical protein GX654_19195, partial [Desulfatiglans sp.]|nr:hypothetical protein [Desulfatiglans sp.]